MTIERDEVAVATPDGRARAWAYRGGTARGSGVLLYTDAFGLRPAVDDMASRLARLGHHVLAPDLFYRDAGFSPFDAATVWSVPAERERLMTLIHSLTPERAALDGAAYLDALAAMAGVRGDRLAVVGYCMGGRLALLAAGQHPERVRAAASFHGGSLATDRPDSPHLLAGRVKGSLLLGIADADASCTPDAQGLLAAALGAAHVDYRMELYAGKRHGFAVNGSPAYDREGSERHWRRLAAFLEETLA